MIERTLKNTPRNVSDKELFINILNNIEYGITVQNRNQQLIYANQAAARMSGYKTAQEFVSTETTKILSKFKMVDENGKPFSQNDLPARKSFKDNKSHQIIIKFRVTTHKKENWALLKAIPILADDGKAKYVINTFQDITRSKIEELSTKHFIAIGSHELKTPLAGIKVLNQLLARELQKKRYENAPIYQIKIDKKVNELTKIINDFLDVEKIHAQKLEFNPEEFDFDSLIDDVKKEFQSITSTHKIVVKGTAKKKIIADKERVIEVLTNILRNAVKYSPNRNMVIIHLDSDKTSVTVGIQDFGVGVATKDKLRIFEPFFRASQQHKVSGLGLGLYISNKLVELHGGKMWIKSKIGSGSTFFFKLPLYPIKAKKQYSF